MCPLWVCLEGVLRVHPVPNHPLLNPAVPKYPIWSHDVPNPPSGHTHTWLEVYLGEITIYERCNRTHLHFGGSISTTVQYLYLALLACFGHHIIISYIILTPKSLIAHILHTLTWISLTYPSHDTYMIMGASSRVPPSHPYILSTHAISLPNTSRITPHRPNHPNSGCRAHLHNVTGLFFFLTLCTFHSHKIHPDHHRTCILWHTHNISLNVRICFVEGIFLDHPGILYLISGAHHHIIITSYFRVFLWWGCVFFVNFTILTTKSWNWPKRMVSFCVLFLGL